MKYSIRIETRKEGAIGEFELDTIVLDANTALAAQDMALALVRRNGLEPRAILSIREI